MCVKYLGFVLLACFPGLFHAQSATQPCSAPSLNGGYWVPERDTYNHEAKLTYGCDNGRKPAVEGWWAKSTCENGTWSPKPQCIDEKACVPPTILNAIYTVSTNGWYEDDDIIRITCDKGYEYKRRDATAQCINGSWTSVPVCEKSVHACGEPPQVPHAVIILQGYQDFFAVDTKLQYECEDGYTVDGAVTKTSIYCISGNWNDGPVCSNTERGAGLGGSADVGTGEIETTSAGSGTQPEGGANRPGTGHDRGSAGSGTSPAGGVSFDHCGAHPQVPNGVIVQEDALVLRFQCNLLYTQVGSATVTCHNNGSWSQLPICKAAFCILDRRSLTGLNSEVEYLKEGEEKYLSCTWRDYFRLIKCTNGKISSTRCCNSYQHYHGVCY